MSEFALEIPHNDEAQRELDFSEGLRLLARASRVSSTKELDSFMFNVCNAVAAFNLDADTVDALPSESAIQLAEQRIISQLGVAVQSSVLSLQEVYVEDPVKNRMGRVPC